VVNHDLTFVYSQAVVVLEEVSVADLVMAVYLGTVFVSLFLHELYYVIQAEICYVDDQGDQLDFLSWNHHCYLKLAWGKMALFHVLC
jgi:hypothetical protein